MHGLLIGCQEVIKLFSSAASLNHAHFPSLRRQQQHVAACRLEQFEGQNHALIDERCMASYWQTQGQPQQGGLGSTPGIRKWAWEPSECSAMRDHCRKLSNAGCKSGLVSKRPSNRAAMSLMLPGDDMCPLYIFMILDTIGGQLPELHRAQVAVVKVPAMLGGQPKAMFDGKQDTTKPSQHGHGIVLLQQPKS